ncbi:MAG: transglutaminase family protein [Pirellulales bacterium]
MSATRTASLPAADSAADSVATKTTAGETATSATTKIPAAAPDAAPSTDTTPPAPPTAKNRFAIPDPALELTDPRTYRLRVLIRIDAPEAPVKGVVATGPIPMDWPEQRVRLLSQKLSPGSRVSEQILKGQAALLKFQVANVPKGGSASVERLYEITRYRTKFSLPGEDLEMPRGAPPEMKEQLAGTPPGVDLDNPKMIELAETLHRSAANAGPWEVAKAFWSWTRDNVKFENGDFRGAMHAIDNHCGDCEEMSALFVGMCRLNNIPARTVWVEGHDYPEFYLMDKQGKGHWIPAQVLGPPWFGEMAEYRPILQKGDRFYDPLAKTYVRYVPQTVRGAHANVKPKVQFLHQILTDTDINSPTYNNASSRDRQK